MELHPLAPLLCSAAILRRQRFPVPGWGLIHSHYFTTWYRILNYHVIISRVELLDCSIQQLDKTMQAEIITRDLLRSQRQKSEVQKMSKHKATSCLLPSTGASPSSKRCNPWTSRPAPVFVHPEWALCPCKCTNSMPPGSHMITQNKKAFHSGHRPNE